MTENNLLISNFDRKIEHGLRFVSGVRIVERYSYTPIQGGYDETVIVEGDRERLREAVARGLDYARDYGLTVKVNNPLVREDLKSDIFDTTGLLVVDCVERTIVDDRDLQKKGVSNMKNNPEALQELAENLLDALEQNLLVALEQNNDCSEWDCSKCPYRLEVIVEDPRYGNLNCSWLLINSATSKILRK